MEFSRYVLALEFLSVREQYFVVFDMAVRLFDLKELHCTVQLKNISVIFNHLRKISWLQVENLKE